MTGRTLDEITHKFGGFTEFVALGVDASALAENRRFCPVSHARFRDFDVLLNCDDVVLFVGRLPRAFTASGLVDSVQSHYQTAGSADVPFGEASVDDTERAIEVIPRGNQ